MAMTKKKEQELEAIGERSSERLLKVLSSARNRQGFMKAAREASGGDLTAITVLYDLTLGDDFDALCEIYDDDAEKVDTFVTDLMQSKTAGK